MERGGERGEERGGERGKERGGERGGEERGGRGEEKREVERGGGTGWTLLCVTYNSLPGDHG